MVYEMMTGRRAFERVAETLAGVMIRSELDRFLMIKDDAQTNQDAAPGPIIVVLDWFDELKERVPTP